MRHPQHTHRAFTIRELVAVIVISVLLAAIISVVVITQRYSANCQMDQQNLRAMNSALVVAGGGPRHFLPSELDTAGTTVPQLQSAKDTSSNIWSIFIYGGWVQPEMLVSPLESNPNIVADNDYNFNDPPTAVVPKQALWDPAFNADFTDKTRKANLSYAHILPSKNRKEFWADTFGAEEPILSNRGPAISGVSRDTAGNVVGLRSPATSNTYLFFKPRGTWSGNVCFNDLHVAMLSQPVAPPLRYETESGKTNADVLFFDEPDDPKGVNFILSIFTKISPDGGNYAAIWD